MRISALFLICGGLALSNAALAQEVATTDAGGTDTAVTDGSGTASVLPEASSYDQLSYGNQKIAESLFQGQVISGDGSGEAMSLDQIAAARQDGQGWGQIFKQMKADGLVEAKNLGQLVSGRNKTGKSFTLGSGTEQASAIDGTTAGETGTGDAADTGTGGTVDGTTTPEVAPEVGAFDQLSPGNRKIAESLFEGQVITGDGTGEALTLDQIAATRQDGQGWGQIFKQMKSDGLVEAKNLGHLVSGHGKVSKAVYNGGGSRSKIVMTTGSGRTMSFGKSGRSGGAKGSLGGGHRSGHKGGVKYSAAGGRSGSYARGVSGGFKSHGGGVSKTGHGGGSFKGKSGKAK